MLPPRSPPGITQSLSQALLSGAQVDTWEWGVKEPPPPPRPCGVPWLLLDSEGCPLIFRDNPEVFGNLLHAWWHWGASIIPESPGEMSQGGTSTKERLQADSQGQNPVPLWASL